MATMNGMPTDGDPDERRVLLVVRGDRDRELLSSWLSAEFEVTTARPEDDWGPFDVCIVDAENYEPARASLVAHREAASPVFLPVLLLVPENAHDTDWIGRELGDTVDQVLSVPTRKRVLRSHLESLLRTRRLSRELAEQRERSEMYRRAMDEAAVGIIITDPTRADNPITYVNDRFEELTGYEASEILGRNCRFLQGPETDEEPVRRMREAIDAGEPVTVELLNYRKDGTPFWNRVTITPVYGDGDERDEVTCFLGFQEDVTESRERERELELYETIVEAADDPIYAVDSNGRFTLANEACLQVFDTAREELYGSNATEVLDPETYGAFDELVGDLLNGDERRRTVEMPMSFDGERRLFEVSVALVTRNGDFQGSVGVARDVTELRQRERRLTVLDRVLRHNLRNKMNIVLARAEAIAEQTDDPELGAYARAIERASSQLLDLSEEARRFEETIDPDRRENETWDVAALVEKVIDVARTDYPEADVAADLRGRTLVRGPGTLELALAELVENAVEHNDRERPTVRITVATEGDEVAIGIADDGPGFGDMERRALLRGSEQPLEHLEGIGLWLVRWTVTGAGGDLAIEENDPRGSVVTVRLPRVRPEGPGDDGSDTDGVHDGGGQDEASA